MKAQKVAGMVEHVRTILDRNRNSVDLASINDLSTLSLNELIRGVLEEAVSVAVDMAPASYFENAEYKYVDGTSTLDEVDSGGKVYRIMVPSMCKRILNIECDTWRGSLSNVVDIDSQLWRMAKDKYLKTVGVEERPVAALGYDEGKKEILLMPVCNNATLTYIELPRIYTDEEDEEEYIMCDDLIYECACYYAAYLVGVAQQLEGASLYQNEAIKALNIVVNKDAV